MLKTKQDIDQHIDLLIDYTITSNLPREIQHTNFLDANRHEFYIGSLTRSYIQLVKTT